MLTARLNGWSANHLFRVTPLLKSHLDVSLGVRQFVFAMSRTAYDKLPEAAKAIARKHREARAQLVRIGAGDLEQGRRRRERADAKALGTLHALSAGGRGENKLLRRAAAPLRSTKWVAGHARLARTNYAFLQQVLADYRKTR